MARTTLAERQARIAQQRAKLQQEEQRLRDAERKARTRRLIEAGGLIDKAGLLDLDPNALYGALLMLAEQAADADTVKYWTARGHKAFGREAEAREASREPLLLTFPDKLPAHVSTRLRGLGFRWSKVMNHWEGHADPEAAGAIANEHNGSLRRMEGGAGKD